MLGTPPMCILTAAPQCSVLPGIDCCHSSIRPPCPAALQLDGSAFNNTNWCRFHPNVATHALIADQLAAFVRGVLPNWAA